MLRVFDYEKLPIVEIVNEIIYDASSKGASDIHFDPHEDILKIRIRIDGALTEYATVPVEVKKNLITRVKIMAGMNITETRLPQDGAIKSNIKNKDVDLRVSCIPTHLGEKIVIRILDFSMSNNGIETLGFSAKNLEKMYKLQQNPNGIILVTGATGSGKSTTVYSTLQGLNKPDVNIITVEDPVEMGISGINQIQVNSEIGLDFAKVLRSILRQDPDIVMIGEIRDSETAKIAVRASITGHLVLSTLHTNNALNTIERLLDMDVERFLLASALEGIVSQKLARKLCDQCKIEKQVTEYEKDLFKKILGIDVNAINYPNGCELCNNGYKGRIPIHEVLIINEKIRTAISNNDNKDVLRKLVYSSGVTTMIQDGFEKVLQGQTSVKEILKLIDLDDDLDRNYSLDKALDETNLVNNINADTKNETSITNEDIKVPEFKDFNFDKIDIKTDNKQIQPKVEINKEPQISNEPKIEESEDLKVNYDDILKKYNLNFDSNEDEEVEEQAHKTFEFTTPNIEGLDKKLKEFNNFFDED
ncbi:MAG: GspE/PulE family protein [Bacilli bacterium]